MNHIPYEIRPVYFGKIITWVDTKSGIQIVELNFTNFSPEKCESYWVLLSVKKGLPLELLQGSYLNSLAGFYSTHPIVMMSSSSSWANSYPISISFVLYLLLLVMPARQCLFITVSWYLSKSQCLSSLYRSWD